MDSQKRPTTVMGRMRDRAARRRAEVAFQNALNSAGPSMRDELILIAQRNRITI